MSLRGVAGSTLEVLRTGRYRSPSGGEVDLSAALEAAVAGARLYAPGQLSVERRRSEGAPPMVEVTSERTQEAAYRLVVEEGERVALLSFASARRPGGGFLNGAVAQEEDLARCSGLYACLQTQPGYYAANRAERTLLYTDHMIWAPEVPFFRRRNRDLLEAPFLASVITAPAPNAGQALRRDPTVQPEIERALRRRAGRVLALAEAKARRVLILGAWGCGVFRNQPAQVADAFGCWLEDGWFGGSFDRIVFAIYDRSRGCATLRAFEDRLARRDA